MSPLSVPSGAVRSQGTGRRFWTDNAARAREAVAGGYGGIFGLLTPTGAMLVARGVSQSGQTAFAAAFLIWE